MTKAVKRASDNKKLGDDPMGKVLQLISAHKIFGAERVSLQLCSSLRERFDLILGVMDRPEARDNEVLRQAKEIGVRTVHIPTCSPLDRRALSYLKQFIRREGVSLVHSHNYKSNFYALLARGRAPWMATAHCWGGTDRKAVVYETIDKFLIRFADCIVGVSLNLMEEFKALRISPKKTVYIPNGIDSHWGGERELDDVFTVGFVGRFEREKNFTYVIKTFLAFIKEAPFKCQALVIGDGSLRHWAEEEIKRNGLEEKIFFTGKVPAEEMERYYRQLDCLFIPSLKEGLPMVVLEALSWGIPIVGSLVALRDVGKGPYAQIMEDPTHISSNVEAIKALARLYFEEPLTYQEVMQRARDRAQDFSLSKMVDAYASLYSRLLERNPESRP